MYSEHWTRFGRDSRASLLVGLTIRDLARKVLQIRLFSPRVGILRTGAAIPTAVPRGCAVHTRCPALLYTATHRYQSSAHSLDTTEVSIDPAHRTAASVCFQIQPSEKILSLCFKSDLCFIFCTPCTMRIQNLCTKVKLTAV